MVLPGPRGPPSGKDSATWPCWCRECSGECRNRPGRWTPPTRSNSSRDLRDHNRKFTHRRIPWIFDGSFSYRNVVAIHRRDLWAEMRQLFKMANGVEIQQLRTICILSQTNCRLCKNNFKEVGGGRGINVPTFCLFLIWQTFLSDSYLGRRWWRHSLKEKEPDYKNTKIKDFQKKKKKTQSV